MNKVAAVVVTYNRIELLKECIKALQRQTYPCDILIVDNASTDGTGEYLNKIDDTNIFYQNTGANIGGAGGFNFGMRWAVESGYEYVWVMDDDCLSYTDALQKLMKADGILKGNYGWLSSIGLWKDKSICPMNIQRQNPYKAINSFDKTIIPAQMASFVSLFIKANVIQRYGLPIREFFIWTDDWEFTRRISIREKCYVVSNSKVIHAMHNKNVVNIALDTKDRISRYCYFYRNDVYLYRREGFIGWCWLFLKFSWHILQIVLYSEIKIKKIKIILSGLYEGLKFRPVIERINNLSEVEYK